MVCGASRGSNVRVIVLMIELRIAEPDLDRGLAPADDPFADRHLCGKGAGLQPSVRCGPAETGAVKHGLHPEDAVGFVGHDASLRCDGCREV